LPVQLDQFFGGTLLKYTPCLIGLPLQID